MELTRRLVLKAVGALGVAGGGGFAANEVLAPRSWLYDPSAVTEAHNIAFLRADMAEFFENIPAAYREQFTAGSAAPVDPTEVEEVGFVNGFSFVGDTGLPTGMATVAASGEFRTAPFRGLASGGVSGIESAGEYGGYDVYVAETRASPLQAAGVSAAGTGGASGGDADGAGPAGQPVSVEETALGVTQPEAEQSGLVAGTTLGTDDIPATTAVEQAIDAKQGNAPVLAGMNKYTQQYNELFGDQTLFMGAVWDPAFITLLVAGTSLLLENLAGPGAAVSELFQRLYEDARGAGAGVDIGADETTTTLLLTYVTQDAARQTGLVQLLDAGFGYVDRNEGFGPGVRDIDADYRGRNIVLRVRADTRTALTGGVGAGTTTTTEGGSGLGGDATGGS